jgi:hypothetical protein
MQGYSSHEQMLTHRSDVENVGALQLSREWPRALCSAFKGTRTVGVGREKFGRGRCLTAVSVKPVSSLSPVGLRLESIFIRLTILCDFSAILSPLSLLCLGKFSCRRRCGVIRLSFLSLEEQRVSTLIRAAHSVHHKFIHGTPHVLRGHTE